jgi:hypothetical protein
MWGKRAVNHPDGVPGGAAHASAGSPAGCRSAERAHKQYEQHHHAEFIHASVQSEIQRHFRMVGPQFSRTDFDTV